MAAGPIECELWPAGQQEAVNEAFAAWRRRFRLGRLIAAGLLLCAAGAAAMTATGEWYEQMFVLALIMLPGGLVFAALSDTMMKRHLRELREQPAFQTDYPPALDAQLEQMDTAYTKAAGDCTKNTIGVLLLGVMLSGWTYCLSFPAGIVAAICIRAKFRGENLRPGTPQQALRLAAKRTARPVTLLWTLAAVGMLLFSMVMHMLAYTAHSKCEALNAQARLAAKCLATWQEEQDEHGQPAVLYDFVSAPGDTPEPGSCQDYLFRYAPDFYKEWWCAVHVNEQGEIVQCLVSKSPLTLETPPMTYDEQRACILHLKESRAVGSWTKNEENT